MALIKTIAEVRAVLKISALNNVSSLPDFDNTGELFIKPILGEALYATLQTAYDLQTLTTAQTKLLFRVQKALAAFGYVEESGLLNVMFTDTGWRQVTTDELPQAFKWQVQDALDALKSRAYNAQEQLFQHLLANKVVLNWNDSGRKKTLITNGFEFQECYNLYQPLRTFFLLRPAMLKAEDLYIKKTIGEAFFNDLKSKATLTPEETELKRLLSMAIAHFTIKHAIESLPVQKSENGFTVVNAAMDRDSKYNNQSTAKQDLLEAEKAAADRDGQQYLKDAKFLLNSKASGTIFPLYFTSTSYKPIITDITSRNAGKKTFRF